MILRYRKKPIVIDAMQWIPDLNTQEMIKFCSPRSLPVEECEYCGRHSQTKYEIETLEGSLMISPGDYIIKGVNGEFYPCKPDIFLKTYEIFNYDE